MHRPIPIPTPTPTSSDALADELERACEPAAASSTIEIRDTYESADLRTPSRVEPAALISDGQLVQVHQRRRDAAGVERAAVLLDDEMLQAGRLACAVIGLADRLPAGVPATHLNRVPAHPPADATPADVTAKRLAQGPLMLALGWKAARVLPAYRAQMVGYDPAWLPAVTDGRADPMELEGWLPDAGGHTTLAECGHGSWPAHYTDRGALVVGEIERVATIWLPRLRALQFGDDPEADRCGRALVAALALAGDSAAFTGEVALREATTLTPWARKVTLRGETDQPLTADLDTVLGALRRLAARARRAGLCRAV